MRCPNPRCRHEIDDNSVYCEYCGTKVKKTKWPLYVGLGVLAVALVVGIVFVIPKGGGGSSKNEMVFTVKGVRFSMKLVEGGSFMMGATPDQGDEAKAWEKPAHRVTLDSYYIGETEVPQALWEAVMDYNPSKHVGGDYPVDCVTWEECVAFCEQLSQKLGKRFRLPTEAEWEFAARGGNKTEYYRFSGSNNIDQVAWHIGNSDSISHPVKLKMPNELGLYDMTGNAWEICSDWYERFSGSPEFNPQGPYHSEKGRVRRGGGWLNAAKSCRISYRYYTPQGQRNDFLGFRLAMDGDN